MLSKMVTELFGNWLVTVWDGVCMKHRKFQIMGDEEMVLA